MNQYITTGEAVKLSNQCTANDLDAAYSIYKEYLKERSKAERQFGDEWVLYSAMAAVFNASRVAGIREERAKRKKAKQ